MPKLLVRHPEMGEMTFSLAGERLSVGRRADNAIQINHSTVSGHHAELVAVNGHYLFRDLDSTNHSFVEGFQISEMDLTERCQVQIGTVECEYLPDEPGPKTTPLADDNHSQLRKTIGHLREQNEGLIAKLNEQQKQIDILGSARLLTPATGASINALRAEVKILTTERDKLLTDNKSLNAEIMRLRGLVAIGGDSSSLKKTAVIRLPLENSKIAAPLAREETPEESALRQINELLLKARATCASLASQPDQREPQLEMAELCGGMLALAERLNNPPAQRLISCLEALARDIAAQPGTHNSSIHRTTTQAVELLSTILTPEILAICNDMVPPRVLAVDDDEDLLAALIAALEYSHLSITGCATAGAALEILNSKIFDLVLLDIQLAGSNGVNACAQIREIPAHRNTPIVFVSGEDSLENRERGAANGGNDFVGKPFNVFDLTLKAYIWAYRHQLAI